MKQVSLSMALVLCASILSVKDTAACDKHFIALKNAFTKPALMAKAKDPCATVESAEAYLETGTSVDFEDKDGNTPLLLAAMNDNAKFVEFFIGRGANIAHKNKEGKTALILAAEKQCFETAKVLIKYKADVNARDNKKWTPLLYAARTGNVIMIELLLDYGANILTGTVFHCAVASGSLPAVKAIIEYAKLKLPNGSFAHLIGDTLASTATPLMIAAEWGHDDIVDYLIANGADVNKAKNDNTTALHKAAIFGHASTVKKLLDHGANVNAKDAKGRTPLIYAVQGRYETIAAILIKHGADGSITDIYENDWTDFAVNDEFYDEVIGNMLNEGYVLENQQINHDEL